MSLPPDPMGRGLNSDYDDVMPTITGRYVVFASDRKGSQDIYLYDLVERRLIDLLGLNALDSIASAPSISRDGRYVVFTGNRQGQIDVYLYDRQLRILRNLTETLNAEVRAPTISADGSTIAFASSANGQWDILLYNRAGEPLGIPVTPR